MADMCDVCGDGVVELLVKLLSQERDNFIRLGQINQSIAAGGGGGGGGGNVNLTGILGVAPSVGCGTSDVGTLRVAPATDCTAPVSVQNGAGAAAVNVQDGGNSLTVDGAVTVSNAAGASAVNIQDGGNSITVDGAVTVSNAGGASAVNIQDGGNSITVDGSVSSTTTSVVPGTGATNLGKAEDSAHTTGDTGVMSLGVSNEAQSTLNADGDYSVQATDTKGNQMVVGNLAHDAVDAGNPVKIGFQGRTTLPTAVADADRINGISDKFGRQIVQHSIRDIRGNQQTTITSSTAETTIVTANASAMLDLYALIVANTSATATTLTIKDSTGGTTRFILMIPAGDTRGFCLPACDGHKQSATNNNWTATCGTSVASIQITALFIQNPS